MTASDDPVDAADGAVVRVFDETTGAAPPPRIDTQRWARLASAVLRDEGIGSGELGLRFVDPDTMADLNVNHMGSPGPTDVLAFPIDATDGAAGAPGPTVLLGDVVVCPAYAAASEGLRESAALADELALLVVHGVLHVLGHDHAVADEAAAMKARERRLLAAHHRS